MPLSNEKIRLKEGIKGSTILIMFNFLSKKRKVNWQNVFIDNYECYIERTSSIFCTFCIFKISWKCLKI